MMFLLVDCMNSLCIVHKTIMTRAVVMIIAWYGHDNDTQRLRQNIPIFHLSLVFCTFFLLKKKKKIKNRTYIHLGEVLVLL